METFRKLGFHGELDDSHISPQGKLKDSNISKRTSSSEQLLERFHSDVRGSFIEGYWGKDTVSFSSTRGQERLLSRH
jgi:hypothetical protein